MILDKITDVLLIFFGWLLGTLSPGVVDAIAKNKRRREVLGSIATELHELRFLLAMVLTRVRSKLRNMDQPTLALTKPILLAYGGDAEDTAAQAGTRKLLEAGDVAYISLLNSPSAPAKSLLPVPYDAPFLLARVNDIGLFTVPVQQRVLRVVRELSLFNHQVDIVRQAHNRTFDSSLSAANHRINLDNLDAGTEKLAVRARALILAINEIVTEKGEPVHHAR